MNGPKKPPSEDLGFPDSAGATTDDERERLELEKLRLEIDQIKKGDLRSTVSSFAPVFLSLATVFLGIAGLFLNSTINRAAEQQHAFENYTRLTEEFAKSGSAKLGAIVGFRAFLRPWTDRSEQTIELLASDLLGEHDPIARRAVVYDLAYAGLPAFGRVREVNVVTRERMRHAAIGLFLDKYYPKARPFNPFPIPDSDFVRQVAFDLRTAADQYEPEVTQRALLKRQRALRLLTENDVVDGFSYEVALRKRALSSPNTLQHWTQEYFNEAPAFFASAEILRSLLNQRSTDLTNLDAAGIAVYDVDLAGADLEGIDLSKSFVDGRANGADLTNANLSGAKLLLDLGRSGQRSTSLCGANLDSTKLQLLPTPYPTSNPAASYAMRARLPNLTATRWWSLPHNSDFDDVESALKASFPAARNEKLASLSADDRKRLCRMSKYTQGGPTPEP